MLKPAVGGPVSAGESHDLSKEHLSSPYEERQFFEEQLNFSIFLSGHRRGRQAEENFCAPGPVRRERQRKSSKEAIKRRENSRKRATKARAGGSKIPCRFAGFSSSAPRLLGSL
jgi:hypothetical protein